MSVGALVRYKLTAVGWNKININFYFSSFWHSLNDPFFSRWRASGHFWDENTKIGQKQNWKAFIKRLFIA